MSHSKAFINTHDLSLSLTQTHKHSYLNTYTFVHKVPSDLDNAIYGRERLWFLNPTVITLFLEA